MTRAIRHVCRFGMVAAALIAGSAVRAAPTPCDRLASHPADPGRKATGVERSEMNLPAAEVACRDAVAADPRNARARYQLGRVLYYQDKVEESLEHLERASDIGYPQAIFVLGFLHVDGKAPRDACKTARLWLRSAGLDHPWSGYYLIENALDGRFDECEPDLTPADLDRYLELARENLTVSASDGRVEALAERLAASRRSVR